MRSALIVPVRPRGMLMMTFGGGGSRLEPREVSRCLATITSFTVSTTSSYRTPDRPTLFLCSGLPLIGDPLSIGVAVVGAWSVARLRPGRARAQAPADESPCLPPRPTLSYSHNHKYHQHRPPLSPLPIGRLDRPLQVVVSLPKRCRPRPRRCRRPGSLSVHRQDCLSPSHSQQVPVDSISVPSRVGTGGLARVVMRWVRCPVRSARGRRRVRPNPVGG